MKKLELKHIAPYLPYKLQGVFNLRSVADNYPNEMRRKELKPDAVDFFVDYCKPVFRPLSDLTKEIEHNGERFNPMRKLGEFMYIAQPDSFGNEKDAVNWVRAMTNLVSYDCLNLPYFVCEKLFEWHFDVFGLIDEGLAIDINTLKHSLLL